MLDHILDVATQEFLITRFRLALAPPLTPAIAALRLGASEFLRMQSVAWAMRVHRTNRQIQEDGVLLMSYMEHDPAPDGILVLGFNSLAAYIISTVAVVMHDNLALPEIQRACLQTLANVLLEMDCFRDKRIVGNGNHLVIDKFRLVQDSRHNLPALVVRAMLAHGKDHALQTLGTDVLHTYMRILNTIENKQPMPDFILHEFETVLLATMRRYSYAGDVLEGGANSVSVQQSCIYVLEQFMQYDFAGMRRVADFMQYTVNATIRHTWELAEDMERVFLDIMHRLEASGSSPLQIQHMQSIGASSGMMQVSVAFMYDRFRAGTLQDADSDAHIMLLKICTGNPTTTALMVRADVLESIDDVSRNLLQSATWRAIRAQVFELLRSDSTPTDGAVAIF
jgi:hypothetical protein